MNSNELDTEVVKDFWKDRATFDTNRWTPGEIVEFEINTLTPLAENTNRIADIGSGTGDLSRTLAGTEKTLVAVDFIDSYERVFDQENHTFVVAQATDIPSDLGQFGLILLMGVVTYLSDTEELSTYQQCANLLASGGKLYVKHQCSRGEEFIVNGWSEELASEYSARYPSYDSELNKLHSLFEQVDVVEYPNEFNKWDTSFHVAFICSNPK